VAGSEAEIGSAIAGRPLEAHVRAGETRHARKRPSDAKLYTLLGIVLFFWALNYTIGKVALREFPPLLLTGLRTILSGALMIPVYAWSAARGGSGARLWTRKDVPRLLILGVFGIALNQLCFVQGLGWTSVGHAAILAGTIPMMVLLTAAARGMEHLERRKVVGMVVALAGVGALHISPEPGGDATVVGDLMILGSAFFFALFTVYGKGATAEVGSLTVNAFAYVGGALAVLPLTFWQSAGFHFSSVSLAAWASLAYMAALPGVLCYILYAWVLEYMPASRVSMLSYLQPVLSILFAIPLLGERVTAGLMAGGVLVLAGVFLAERN
jgi:drug/metabolite transporter (DMT)-like permease